jgi:N-acetylglucosaminyldiphosphoundecaprenol N-acetyl-beta-D-mannosaminyltransferase
VVQVNILGVGVSAISLAQAVEIIEEWIAHRQPHYVCVTGVHGLMESQRDAALRRIHNQAGLVTPDGMPLVWISRWQGQTGVTRVYGPDLMLATCDQLRGRNARHFFYGGTQHVAQRLAAALGERFPGIIIAGTYSPPFRPLTPQEDAQIVETINRAQPHLIWVGLGTPKQERWMAAHVDCLEGAVLIGVGAAFDFLSGHKRQAPRWVRQSGLEWLFRLFQEPRRLWRRYLLNNPTFVLLLLAQLLGLREYELEPRSDTA